MDDRSENSSRQKKKGESNMAGGAAVVLCICVCFIIDTRLGLGAIVGAVAGFFAWSLLGDGGSGGDGEEKGSATFLDTAVLQRNFPIPQNMPIPYAVLDIRGHILMVNETFAKEFPDTKKVVPMVEQLKKAGTGKHISVEVEGKCYDAMLNQCQVVEENGAVGAVLNLTMVDISRQRELEQKLDSSETVIGLLFLDNYEDVVDSLAE
ncbi:MAG: hypothetical protein ACI4TP_06955, partial [Anaerotignum sp.]